MSGAGSADVVVVDAKGEITIVECKLAKNQEMRRWVIGQLFEYAAALWKLDIEDFERSLAAGCTALTKPFKDSARWQEATFRSAVSRNLAAGAFRLIIAVDEITERLKRTVVFINSLTPPEVRFLALELRRAGEKGVHLPAPTAYGDNSAEIGPRRPTFKPDRWTLIAGLETAGAARAAEGLLDWAEGPEPRVCVDYRPNGDGVIETFPGGRLFRITHDGEIRVSSRTLKPYGESWDDECIKRFVKGLDEIGLRLKQKRPRAPS